jgi:hypothetical protein
MATDNEQGELDVRRVGGYSRRERQRQDLEGCRRQLVRCEDERRGAASRIREIVVDAPTLEDMVHQLDDLARDLER